MAKRKHERINVVLRYVDFDPVKPDKHVETRQDVYFKSFAERLIKNEIVGHGVWFKFGETVLAQKKTTLLAYGIEDNSVIEVRKGINPKATRAISQRTPIEGFENLRTPQQNLFKLDNIFVNYLVASRSLANYNNLEVDQRFKRIEHSGVSMRTNVVNRVKQNKRKFDLKRVGPIVLFQWSNESAQKLGFPTSELATIGFEILINEMDGQFCFCQKGGTQSQTTNVMAYSIAKKIPGVREFVKQRITEALDYPDFFYSEEEIAENETLADANNGILIEAENAVKSLVKSIEKSPEAGAFKLHVEKSLKAWTYLTEDIPKPIETDVSEPLPTTTDVQNDVNPSSSNSSKGRKRTQKSVAPDVSEPPIKKTLILESTSQKAKSLNKQGIEKFKNKQYEEAFELYFKAIGIEEVGSNNLQWISKVWNNISACWFELKRVDKALEAIEKAIACDSSNAGYFYMRGTYYKRLGDREKTIMDFKKSLELDPGHTNAKKSLAKLEKKN